MIHCLQSGMFMCLLRGSFYSSTFLILPSIHPKLTPSYTITRELLLLSPKSTEERRAKGSKKFNRSPKKVHQNYFFFTFSCNKAK